MSGRVLVTGSEGFTGRYVCEEFSRAGWEVWGAGLQTKPGKPRYLTIDLLRIETLKQINKKVQPDLVIHLAASAFVAQQDSAIFYDTNLIGTRNLLEVLNSATKAPTCTILASSANVYGTAGSQILTEHSPTYPANDYAVSKLAMEYVAKLYVDKLPIVITRPFNYTGVGQNERFIIPKIVKHVRDRSPVIELGNLDVSREFSDVRDIALNYRLLAEHRPIGQIVNLCSGNPLSLRNCLSLAQNISGHRMEVQVSKAFVRSKEIATLSGDRSKLESLTASPAPREFTETLTWMLNGVY